MSVSKSQKRTQEELHLKKEECSTESERQNALVKTESEHEKNNHKRAIQQQPANKITPKTKPDKPLLL